jgi:hypothetical protein
MYRLATTIVSFLGCQQVNDTGTPAEVHVDIPSHSECRSDGSPMPEASCLALVEEDGRLPGESMNKSSTDPDPDDPRQTDPEYTWLRDTLSACACVCCHKASYGGPGTYFWDMDHTPVWIDSAGNWTLSVLKGASNEPDQTVPTDDLERVAELVEREKDRREEAAQEDNWP